jgi:hypothetical protein
VPALDTATAESRVTTAAGVTVSAGTVFTTDAVGSGGQGAPKKSFVAHQPVFTAFPTADIPLDKNPGCSVSVDADIRGVIVVKQHTINDERTKFLKL